MRSQKSINIVGWILAFLSTFVYVTTMYPTIAFWDSGEFVTTAATLQVGHAPGAPFYQILGSFLAIFGFHSPTWICRLVSLISPLAMGLSVMFLFWILMRMLERFSAARPGNIIASAVGALTFAFLDSVWFSATETEVYALAVLLSLIVLWAVLKWDSNSQKRYLLLATYVLGVAVTVHQLSLLVLPASIIVFYFHKRRTGYKGLLAYLGIGALALVLLLWLSYSGVLKYLSLFPVPAIGLLVYLIAASIALLLALRFKKPWLEFSILALTFYFIGLSTYCIIPIRSSADVPINTQSPDTTERLLDYTLRSNYTSAPLFYGQYYTALPPESFIQKPQTIEPVFAKEQMTVFPRMWDYQSSASENGYIEWTGLPEDMVLVNGEMRPKPTFSQNLTFLFSYQINYMYFRYLLINFCGRTNDMQGYGDSKNSQWSVGINAVDRLMGVDNREVNPQASKAKNSYFAIPLLLSLIGMFYQASKDTKHFTVNALLFFYNSLALVFFLNMSAYQARERDYIYLLSFAAMAMWLSIGVISISLRLVKLLKLRKPRYVAWIFLFVPALLFCQNFDDHNHFGQFTARNYAISLLESCEKDAVLFTNGDNDTFPLWYVQQIEGVRRDVRVVNLQLLNSTSYIEGLQHAQYSSKPLKTTLTPSQYDSLLLLSVHPSFDTVDLTSAIAQLPAVPSSDYAGLSLKHFNTNRFSITLGSENIVFKLPMLDLQRSNLAMLDIIAQNINSRPVYFSSYSVSDFAGLDSLVQKEGLVFRLAKNWDAEHSFETFTKRFQWQNFAKEGIYYNETEREIASLFVKSGIELAYRLFERGERGKSLAVCRLLSEKMPFSYFYTAETACDMAILFSAMGEKQSAKPFLDVACREFGTKMQFYLTATPSSQAQQRPEAFNLVNQWLRLLTQAEEMGFEDIRIPLAESYFPITQQYLSVIFQRMEQMILQPELYEEEIRRQISQIEEIYALSEVYEEPLPPLPDFLQ